jgi:DNA transformation protein and related proteins
MLMAPSFEIDKADSKRPAGRGSGYRCAMTVTADFLNYVLEQLNALTGVTSRRMFGAVGLYSDGRFFAIVAADVLYFKVGDANRGDYEARGMSRFRPYRDRPELSMSYFEVPVEVLEDAEQCVAWARRALAAAN